MRRVGVRAALAAATVRAVVLSACLLTVAAVTLAATPGTVQKRLEDVRVCGATVLDRRAGVCRTDESTRPIVSSAFNCSARARGDPGERFAGRFFYRGQPFPAFGTAVGSQRRGLYVYLTAGPNAMPGGPWACELRVGAERARKTFRSGGPTAPILHIHACRTSQTVLAGATRVCRRDESRTSSFRSTDSVTCSAVFAGGKGKLAGIAFLREGKEAFSGDFELPLPVTAAGPRLDPDPQLQRGSWACRWSLAGRVLATKPFRIS